MTTLNKLMRLGGNWFIPEMARIGFEFVKPRYLIRRRGIFHDVLMLGILSGGTTLRAHIICWTSAGYSVEELSNFPECIGVVLGDVLGEHGIGRAAVWDVGSPDLDRETLEKLHKSFLLSAMPWFASISTPEEYLEKFKWMRGINSEFRERVKAELPSLFAANGER